MTNENSKAELERYVEGFKGAAAIEVANINARCSEIKKQMDILGEKAKQLADEVQQGSDCGVSDINSRCSKIMSRGMSYEELARYAAEGWSWASYNENSYDMLNRNLSVQKEIYNLSGELKQLVSRRDELISSLDEIIQKLEGAADVLEAKCETYEVMKEKAKAPRSTGGKNRDKNTKFPEIREAVKTAWEAWPNRSVHGAKTAFAHKMKARHKEVTDHLTIIRWVTKFEKDRANVTQLAE